jgi:hypothetical protein
MSDNEYLYSYFTKDIEKNEDNNKIIIKEKDICPKYNGKINFIIIL